jgi:hypothetical protein
MRRLVLQFKKLTVKNVNFVGHIRQNSDMIRLIRRFAHVVLKSSILYNDTKGGANATSQDVPHYFWMRRTIGCGFT